MLGKWVKAQRQARGLTQEALAEQIGVGQAYISKMELGDRENPGGKVLGALAKAFGVSLDEVWRMAGLTADPTPPDDLPALLERARALGIDTMLLEAIDDTAQDATPERRRRLVDGMRREVARREAQRQQQQRDPHVGPPGGESAAQASAGASYHPHGAEGGRPGGLARIDARPLGVSEGQVKYSV